MNGLVQLTTDDPEQFSEMLAPLSGQIQVRPLRGTSAAARMDLFGFRRLGLFRVRARGLAVKKQPPHHFTSINLPIGTPFTTRNHRGQWQDYRQDAHVFGPEDPFDFRTPHGCQVLVANLLTEELEGYSAKLLGPEGGVPAHTRQAFANPDSSELFHAIGAAWRRVAGTGGRLACRIERDELEDRIIAAFLMSSGLGRESGKTAGRPRKLDRPLSRAEDYLIANLAAPISRANLAETAGVSIRTLSRAFEWRHGMGPMAFLKARRLDATFRDLLGSAPDGASVTEVAIRYGFTHLGRFSVEYRQAFGESPSATLAH